MQITSEVDKDFEALGYLTYTSNIYKLSHCVS